MNTRAKKELQASDRMKLDELLVMTPGSLNEDQLAHLRARIDYLTEEEIEKFELREIETKPARRGRLKRSEETENATKVEIPEEE